MNKKTYEKYLFILVVIFGSIIFLTIMNAIPTHALECPPACPKPSEYTNCTDNGSRSRIEYTCSNATDYFCEAKKVTYYNSCWASPPLTSRVTVRWDNVAIFVFVCCGLSLIIFLIIKSLGKKRWRKKEIKNAEDKIKARDKEKV